AKHRLGASGSDAADIGISPSERGNVAHKALEFFWRDMKSQRELLALPQQKIDAVIARSVSAALDIQMSRRSRNVSLERSRTLEQTRLQDLLGEWLQKERNRPDFAVLEREQPREVEVAGLKLAIKADRLDRYADGTHAILDYKTSDKQGIKDWEGPRPNAPQLMLYAVKTEHAISSVEFAVLVPRSTYLDGYRGQDLQQRLPHWTDAVEHLAASFMRGDAAVDPKGGAKSCEFCQLHSLCRIAEVRALDAPEDEAGE
ncbi:MAG: PD-(D/E)XK nuclease family protein, partial [Acidobacteriota bacterium]|nr:PD-(D/E)XK nuclease family protein [Acidobacteriota bacterium]